MRFLVTGGAGFIGSHLVEALVKRGEQVTVLDDFSSGQRHHLASCLDRITLIEGDVRDVATVQRTVRGVRFILHQAALRSVPKSLRYPAEYHAVNVSGTLNVLLAAREAKVQRVVCASSSSIYGETEHLPQREDQAVRPLSPYALTKWMGEQYCQLFSRVYGVETVALRYFNVFGPRQSLENEYAVVIPRFITSLLQGQPPPVHGDGLQSRDFTYIENVVAANLLACEAPGANGHVINVACGEHYTVLALLQELQQILHKPIAPTHTPPRPGDVRHTWADLTRAQQLLGYQPTVNLVEGLRRTATWFAQHTPSHSLTS